MPGDPVLGDVAENAVKQWQFRPFMLNGEPVQVDSRIAMKFTKKRAEVVVGER
jgi:outer membrane biosynthesis protein TonB